MPEVSDTLWDTTTNSSVEDVSSLFVLGDLPVGQFEADCASIAMQSGVPISDDPVLIDSDESIQLQRKVRTHECSANCLQQFSNEAAIWGICELSVEKNMLLLGKLITCSMNSKNRGKGGKRRNEWDITTRLTIVVYAAFCILHDISVKKLKNLKAHLQKNGFSAVVHGNHGRRSHQACPHVASNPD